MAAQSAELTIGRTFGVTLQHGDEFFTELAAFCREHGIRVEVTSSAATRPINPGLFDLKLLSFG
jgi:predicted DNA-binding protein with PD1-like motif